MKVGSFSFGSPSSASAVSKPIFDIKAIEEKTNIYTPMLSISVKKSYPLVLWLQAPHQKLVVVGLLIIPEQAYQEVLISDHQQGEVNLRNFLKSRQIMLVVSDW